MPTSQNRASQSPASQSQATQSQDRPSNHEVENENQRPSQGGKAPRPATEPPGSEGSSDSPKTRTDPGSGES